MTDIQSQIPVQRAQWVLTAQPGRQVTAVQDCQSFVWTRVPSEAREEFDEWLSPDGLSLKWSPLLVEFGPLDDATPRGGS